MALYGKSCCLARSRGSPQHFILQTGYMTLVAERKLNESGLDSRAVYPGSCLLYPYLGDLVGIHGLYSARNEFSSEVSSVPHTAVRYNIKACSFGTRFQNFDIPSRPVGSRLNDRTAARSF
jgi:hypothetical protein